LSTVTRWTRPGNGFETRASAGWILIAALVGSLVACRPSTTEPDLGLATARCGNGILEAGEACDQGALGGADCLSAVGALDGQLACTADCQLDTSACHTCGDGDVEPAEQCEPGTVAANYCEAQGLGGAGYCNGACHISGCFVCGDGICSDRDGESIYNCAQDCGGWRDLALGDRHSCAVSQSGAAYCWGDASQGQVGHGGRGTPATPEGVWRVAGLQRVLRITAGAAHTCAINEDGALWCWGANDRGQLGASDLSVASRNTPTPVVGPEGVVAVSAGAAHTCALDGSGAVWCWGANDQGQLGDGTLVDSAVPRRVTASGQAVGVAVGAANTCLIRPDDTLWCWGANDRGQLGIGSAEGPQTCGLTACSPLPVNTADLNRVLSVSLGAAHGCAVVQHRLGEHAQRRLYCWGDNDAGQLGDATLGADCHGVRCQPRPTLVALDWQPARVAAGGRHTCAMLQDGHVWCWGAYDRGQVGRRIFDDTLIGASPAPVDPASVTGVRHLAAGLAHGCAITSDRSLWCWGDNAFGQAAGSDAVAWEPTVLFDRIVR